MNWQFWKKESAEEAKRRTTEIEGPGMVGCHFVCCCSRNTDPLADHGSLYDPYALHGKLTAGW